MRINALVNTLSTVQIFPVNRYIPMPHTLSTDPCNLTPPPARYYNSDLSIWLSVDPMSDKYPSTSPYTYCGNNPVRLMDPDGREIWIVGEDGNRYQYKDGFLYTDKGVAYSGKLKGFAKTALTALNRINKTQMGEELICELQESTEVYSIKKTNGNSEFINHSNSILWNTDGALLPVSNTTLGERFATGDLAHELSHAYDHNFNMTDEGISFGKDSGLGIENSEWLAVYRENLIRHELNKPYRTHYMVEVDKYNNFIGGTGPSMLKDGHPYLPFFYPTVNK